jgi:hypothetical protein
VAAFLAVQLTPPPLAQEERMTRTQAIRRRKDLFLAVLCAVAGGWSLHTCTSHLDAAIGFGFLFLGGVYTNRFLEAC